MTIDEQYNELKDLYLFQHKQIEKSIFDQINQKDKIQDPEIKLIYTQKLVEFFNLSYKIEKNFAFKFYSNSDVSMDKFIKMQKEQLFNIVMLYEDLYTTVTLANKFTIYPLTFEKGFNQDEWKNLSQTLKEIL